MFSQTSALVKETVTQLSTVPVGFFFPLASHWASAIAVWLLRVWCSRNVPDIDVKLPAKWFHIRASCVIELGAVRYPAMSENTTNLTVGALVWNCLKCLCVLPGTLLLKCRFGKVLFFLLISTQNTSSPANTFLFSPQLRHLLPPVAPNDVAVDGLVMWAKRNVNASKYRCEDKSILFLQYKICFHFSSFWSNFSRYTFPIIMTASGRKKHFTWLQWHSR